MDASTWRDALAKHPFFFAAPNRAGNELPTAVRAQRALDAMHDVRQKFSIDSERIYVSGFSGGARMATGLVMAFPDLFAGHIPMGGVFFGTGEELKTLKTKLGHYVFAARTISTVPRRRKPESSSKKRSSPSP